MQSYICSKWLYLGCSSFSSSEFSFLPSSRTWNCPSCCILASPGDPISPILCYLYQRLRHVYLHCTPQPIQPLRCQCSSSPKPRLQACILVLFCRKLPFQSHSNSFPLKALLPYSLLCLPHLTRSDFSNRTQEVLMLGMLNFFTFLLFSVDLTSILAPNLNYSLSFSMPGYFFWRSDCTHSESGSLSPDD